MLSCCLLHQYALWTCFPHPQVAPAVPFCCLGASECSKPVSVCCLYFCKTAKTTKMPLDMLIVMQTEPVCNSTTSAWRKELTPGARHSVGDQPRKFTGIRCVVGNEMREVQSTSWRRIPLFCSATKKSGCLEVRLQYAHQLALFLCCFPQSSAQMTIIWNRLLMVQPDNNL